MNEKKVKLAVVIVNWNGAKILERCLQSLKIQTYRDFMVYIIDNGSTDESIGIIEKNYPEAKIVRLDKNYGFAEPNNIVMRKAIKDSGDNLKYICPLNNDIELDSRYLEELVSSAEKYEAEKIKLGILAAKLMFYFERGMINTVGTVTYPDGSGMERGFKELDEGQYNLPEEVFGSCAGAALYTTRMLREISYKNKKGEDCFFDSDFFAYYEDLDLNYRSRLMGFRAFYAPKAIGYHVHSATGKSYSAFKSYYVHRNQYFVLIKNFPFRYLLKGFALIIKRYFMLISGMVLKKKGPAAELSKEVGKFGVVKIALKSWASVLVSLPQLLRKRRSIQKKRIVSSKEFGEWFKCKNFQADIRKMIYN